MLISGGQRGSSSGSVASSSSSNSNSSQNNGGVCIHCHKTFRQLRSHIQDVHCPTPTPCPLCGKMFSSKHKMFGRKYRSCPNRTRNLVRHLQDLDHTGNPLTGASSTQGENTGCTRIHRAKRILAAVFFELVIIIYRCPA